VERLAIEEIAPESGDDAAHLWLPASALNCYEGDAVLSSWLREPGLLTQRMRGECGAAFNMRVVREAREGVEHVREIELCCGERAWVFAQTRIPRNTASQHPWLLELGENALGETLATRTGVQRTEFEYARLPGDLPLIARALERAGLGAQSLWVRRSRFLVGGASLLEVFLPPIGRPG
jgi:chorismate-pyruvate lyase